MKDLKLIVLVILSVWIKDSMAADPVNVDSLLKIATGKQDTNFVLANHLLGNHFSKGHPDSALFFLQKGVVVAEQLDFVEGRRLTYLSMGGVKMGNGAYEESLEWFQKGLELVDEKKLDQGVRVDFLNNIGIAHYIAGNIGAAIDPYIEATAICRALGLDEKRARLLANLGVFYRSLKKYDEAIKTYKESYALRESRKDTMGMANNLLNMGAAYGKMKQIEQSIDELNKAEKFYTILNSDEDIIQCKIGKGTAYMELEEADKAYAELMPLTKIKDLNIIAADKFNLYITMAKALYSQKKYEPALKNLDLIDDEITKSDHLEQRIAFYKLRADTYLALKKYPKYNEDVTTYIALKEKDNSAYQQQLSEEMVSKYKAQEKDFEIKLLNKQNAFNKEKLKNSRMRSYGLGGVLLILSGFFFYVLRLNKKISTQNNLLAEANARNKELLKEIHHRVKNNLQVMSSLLSLQARKMKDETVKTALNASKSRVQAMSILHQNLYERQNFKELESTQYFEDLIRNIRDIYDFDKKIKIETYMDSFIVDIDILISMGLIVNELICNSLKHGFKERESGLIQLYVMQEKDGRTKIRVKDNGIGAQENFLTAKSGSSLGVKLISSFAKSLSATMDIDYSNGVDITILADIPKKKITRYESA